MCLENNFMYQLFLNFVDVTTPKRKRGGVRGRGSQRGRGGRGRGRGDRLEKKAIKRGKTFWSTQVFFEEKL